MQASAGVREIFSAPRFRFHIPIGEILGLYLGYVGDHGKENGNHYIILGYIQGLFGDNGKDNGNYSNGL